MNHARRELRPGARTAAGTLLVCLLLPAMACGEEPAGGEARSWRGIDFGFFTSTPAVVVLGIAGLGAAWSWEETDETFSLVQQALEGEFIDVPLDVGNTYGSGLVIGGGALGLLAIGALGDSAPVRDFGADLGRSFVYSAMVSGAIKHTVDRPRPSGGSHSFPSGHTTSAFSTVPVIWRHLGWEAGAAAGLLASTTALGRMEDNLHYVSDVIAGAAIGYVVGAAVSSQRARRDRLPQLLVTDRQVGLVWAF